MNLFQATTAQEVETLLAQGANIDENLEDGRTPLVYACERGNYEVIDCLLRHGASIANHCFFDHGHIQFATIVTSPQDIQTNFQIIERLLEAGVNINDDQEGLGATPLCMAIKEKNPEMVEFLLSKGANPNLRSTLDDDKDLNDQKPKETSLMRAFDCIRRFMKISPNIRLISNGIEDCIARQGYVITNFCNLRRSLEARPIFKIILEADENLDEEDVGLSEYYPLNLAFSGGCTRTIEALLKAGAEFGVDATLILSPEEASALNESLHFILEEKGMDFLLASV